MSIIKKCIAAVVAVSLSFGMVAYIPAMVNMGDAAIVADAADSSGFVTKKDSAGRKYIASYNGAGGEITIPSDVSYIGKGAFKDNLKITSVVFPEKCKLGIGDNAFANCLKLEKVVFAGDEKYIGNNAFYNCTALKSVTFEKGDAYIEYIGEAAFRNCFSLSAIEITSGTKKIGDYAFENCLELKSVSVPESVDEVGSKAFGYMYNSSSDKHIIAKEGKGEYISYNEEFDDEIIEWYAQKVQKPITMIVVKNSAAEKYAASNKIRYIKVDKIEKPIITANADTNQVVLSWKQLRDADSYRVDMYDANLGKYVKLRISNAKKMVVSDLDSDTEYIFRVTSLKSYVGSYYDMAYSENVCVRTAKQKSDKNNVSLVLKGSSNGKSVTLTWNVLKDADAYQVYMYDTNSKSYKLYKKTTAKNIKIDGLSSNTEYKFYVAAVKGSSDDFAEISKSDTITLKTEKETVKKTTTSESTVLNVKATTSADSISLEWNPVSGAEKYFIYVYNSKTGKYEKNNMSTGKKSVLSNLESSTKYKLYVSAVKKSGKEYVEIVRSDILSLKTDKKAEKTNSSEKVAILKVSASASTDSIVLEWNTSENADKFWVYVYNTKTKKYDKIKQSSGKKCEITDLESGTEYKLYVSAVKQEKGSYIEVMRSEIIEISTANINRVSF